MNSAPDSPKVSGRARDLVIATDRAIHGLSRHWLFIANLLAGLYVGLPVLAPYLRFAGVDVGAQIIYFVYHFACHQKPERSFFIFGNQMAFCERDTALYGMIFLAGLAYGLLRPRVKPLSLWAAILLTVPIAVDGTGQLLGFWESTWWSRTVTGVLFGLAVVWLVYPYMDEGFRGVRESVESQFQKAGIPFQGSPRP